jgi:hypothetical protein
MLEAMASPFHCVDEQWRFSYLNTAAEQKLGMRRSELLGVVIWDAFPQVLGSDFEIHYRHCMESGEPVAFDAYYPEPLNAWFEIHCWRYPDGLAVSFLDVTARHNLQLAAERSAARAHFVGRVTAELTDTMDASVAAGRLADLVVPEFADWCLVALAGDGAPGGWRGTRFVSGRHRDPAQQQLVDDYMSQRMVDLHGSSLLVESIERGKAQLFEPDDIAQLAATVGPAASATFDALAPAYISVIPLPGSSGTVGALTVVNGADRGRWTDERLLTLEDMALRAGMALDNARMYRLERDLAAGLQLSLLSVAPLRGSSRVAVRYLPAAETAQVGGDWYDAFEQPDGHTLVVIGDVVGHDTVAAAAMGQVRTLVRGIGAVGDDPPVTILTKVDRVLDTLRAGTTATAVVARLEPAPDGRIVLRWSNAGHPPPVVVHADGTTAVLEDSDPDLLLGVVADSPRHESVATLSPGATVLLYTDGLVERRDLPFDQGIADLLATLRDLAALRPDLERLCDLLLSRLLPEHSEDDVALVALRLGT